MYNKKSRNWFIVTYNKPEEFQNLLNTCKEWAYIYHDRDEGKEPHYHILAVFENARYYTGVKKLIAGEQNSFLEPVKTSIQQCYRYLTHEEKNDKAIYDESEIVKSEYFKGSDEKSTKGEEAIQMIDDILNGLSLRELARRYGKDFMKNASSYMNYAQKVARQEHGTIFEYEMVIDNLEWDDCKNNTETDETLQIQLNLFKSIDK